MMESTPDVTTNQLADERLVGGLGLPAALPHATDKFEKKEVRATAEQNLIVMQIVVVRRHCFTISITG